ncbi:hypothetical protein ABTZ92_20540 [Streptomyces albidoflavus]
MSRMRGTSGGRIVGRQAAVVLAAAVLGLAGCSAGPDSGASPAGDRAAAPSAADGAGGGQADNAKRESADEAADGKARPELKGVHLIRTAELHLRVKDVPSALASARSVVEGAGG